jgi:hypothetical protein
MSIKQTKHYDRTTTYVIHQAQSNTSSQLVFDVSNEASLRALAVAMATQQLEGAELEDIYARADQIIEFIKISD